MASAVLGLHHFSENAPPPSDVTDNTPGSALPMSSTRPSRPLPLHREGLTQLTTTALPGQRPPLAARPHLHKQRAQKRRRHGDDDDGAALERFRQVGRTTRFPPKLACSHALSTYCRFVPFVDFLRNARPPRLGPLPARRLSSVCATAPPRSPAPSTHTRSPEREGTGSEGEARDMMTTCLSLSFCRSSPTLPN